MPRGRPAALPAVLTSALSRNSLPVMLNRRMRVAVAFIETPAISFAMRVMPESGGVTFTAVSSSWSRFGPSLPPTVANVMVLAPSGSVTETSFAT